MNNVIFINNSFSGKFISKFLNCGLLLLSFLSTICFAKTYSLPIEGSRLIGQNQYHQVVQGEYFQLIAEKYDVGFLALMAANPDVDPFLPPAGLKLVIPSQMLLPFGKREGIIINLPELRLYYFPENSDQSSCISPSESVAKD